MNRPLVSAIIPAYNGEKYLAQAIKSALAQTYSPLEILVVDDGSMDGTAAIVREFNGKIQYHYQPHQGEGAARNTGIQAAKADFFAFLDCDDLWVENKIQLQMEVLAQKPDINIVFGQIQQFYSPELDEATRHKIACPEQPLAGYIPSGLLIQREAFFKIGFFRIDCRRGTWCEWYTRLLESRLKILTLPDLVAYRRLHETNQWMIAQNDIKQDYIRVLKASLDRRRQKAASRELVPDPSEHLNLKP